MLFMMLGDRESDITHIPFCGEGAKEVADCVVTTYISSRKAQFVPAITEGIVNNNS